MGQTELYRKGLEELKAGRYAEARRLFDENEAKAGTAKETQALLAEASKHLTAGALEPAVEILTRLLDRNPGIAETYLGLARIAMRTGRFKDAKTHATAAVKVAPQLGLGWTLMGLADEAEGRIQDALPNLEKGAQLGAREYLCLYNYGRALAAAGQAAQGIGYLIQATELEPENASGLMALGLVQHKLGRHDEALDSIEAVTEVAPKDPDGWATLADLLFGRKEYAEAKAVLARGLEAVGDHPALLEKATAVAVALNDVKSAAALVERELKVVPRHEEGWLNLANFSLLSGNEARAEEAARELIRLNDKRWEPWQFLGDLYDARHDEAKAAQAYREGLKRAPGQWKLLMNFGAALIQTTDAAKHAEGKQLLIKAREAAPNEPRVLYNLALAHVRLGERAEAIATSKAVQEKFPNAPIAAEARKVEQNLLAQQ